MIFETFIWKSIDYVCQKELAKGDSKVREIWGGEAQEQAQSQQLKQAVKHQEALAMHVSVSDLPSLLFCSRQLLYPCTCWLHISLSSLLLTFCSTIAIIYQFSASCASWLFIMPGIGLDAPSSAHIEGKTVLPRFRVTSWSTIQRPPHSCSWCAFEAWEPPGRLRFTVVTPSRSGTLMFKLPELTPLRKDDWHSKISEDD